MAIVLLKKVQDYIVDGQTVKEILEAKYNGYEQYWKVDGDIVMFWNDVIPKVKGDPFHESIMHRWEVVDDRITAININSIHITPELARVYIV